MVLLKVLAPPMVCAVLKSTKFCVADPVPPLAIPNTPVAIFEASRLGMSRRRNRAHRDCAAY